MPRRRVLPKDVTVSLIAWKDGALLGRCLESLRAQTYPAFRVVVVDNASTDGSVEAAREAFPGAAILRPGRNLGYGGAHNLSFATTGDPYFLVLNADLTLEPDFIARLVEAMEEDPGLGAVSGKLLRVDGAGQPRTLPAGDGSGRRFSVIDSAGIAPDGRGRFRDLGEGFPDDGRARFGEVWGVCGAAAMVRREAVLDAVPEVPGAGRPFDEALFNYYEDADLAWQLRRRGWRARVVPEAVGFHIRGGSGVPSVRVERLLHRNAFWILVKHAGPAYLARIAPGWLAFELAKVAQSITIRPALWRAQWERIRGLPAMWRRRRALRENTRRPRRAPLPDHEQSECALRPAREPVGPRAEEGARVEPKCLS
jgi:GT2 family glycosyltransferase